uniref:Uncharacterized protein n=1 Tax=viral metagenome TaxID=1070528 RepID=A0A6C0JE85_9ZZZZ
MQNILENDIGIKFLFFFLGLGLGLLIGWMLWGKENNQSPNNKTNGVLYNNNNTPINNGANNGGNGGNNGLISN